MRCLFYEFSKTWGRRSFLLALAGALMINVFFLWYHNIPKEGEPEASAYKKLAADLGDMQEEEKLAYLNERMEELEGIAHVQEVLAFDNWEDQEMAEVFREGALGENPGLFEKYFPIYQSGKYLVYTDTFDEEYTLIQDVWQQAQTVFSYEEYLDQVEKNKNALSGISIFAATEEKKSFSSRNIERSADAYGKLKDIEISFAPENGVRLILENYLSDLLLILLVFLLVGMAVYEEKTKQLYFVTRATKKGHLNAIAAQLLSFLLSCILLAFVIYGSSFCYSEVTMGVGDLGRSIQSAACYQESVLRLSIGEYLLLGIFTKAVVLFAIGTWVLLFFMEAKHAVVPYLAGAAVLGASFLFYLLFPAASKWNWIKYMNFAGLLRIENLFGGYVNLNFFGYPAARLTASCYVLAISIIFAVFLNLLFFCRGRNLMMKKGQGIPKLPCREHNSLFLHENYKILIMNKAGVILLFFLILLGYRNLSEEYRITPSESYYRNLMEQLEGDLTEEKETLIQKEQERYEKAFAEIDRIEEMINSGGISKETGESMKLPYYNEVACYSTFQRVEKQYQHVKEKKGQFIYDTGYEYLLGYRKNSFSIQFLLLVMGLLFAFSNAFPMERQKASWGILSATAMGRKKISQSKVFVCTIWTVVFSLGNLVFYVVPIIKTYSVHMLFSGITNLPVYYEMPISIPVWLWLALVVFMVLAVLIAATCIILLISRYMRTQLQALFLGACILLLPLWISNLYF